MSRVPRVVVVGALLLLGGAPARAQISVAPESLRVVLTPGQVVALAVTFANGGAVSAPYCLDVLLPGQLHHAPGTLGAGCGPPGELLARYMGADAGPYWFPYGATVTPDGRLFVANTGGGIARTFELTADLAFVRSFVHPRVTELDPLSTTRGVTYDAGSGTLWWTNVEYESGTPGLPVRRVLLLEGTTDGVATGRRVELPVPPGPQPGNTGRPAGAAYERASHRFYYLDAANDDLWAADTLGAVQPGYPATLAAYPGAYLGVGLDVRDGFDDGPDGVRLEVPVGLEVDLDYDRIVVTDPEGRDLGLETPIPPPLMGSEGVVYGVARSMLDPNGVLFAAYQTGGQDGVAAIRPVPLSPSWLTLGAWMGEVPAGGSGEVSLMFQAGDRPPGVYRRTLVVEDTAGVVLAAVPVALVVEPGTPAEPEPWSLGATLHILPNPVHGATAITLSLLVPADVCVEAFDVLGRRVALVYDGPLPAGTHTFSLDASALRPGVHIVRVAGPGIALSQRMTVAP